MNTHLSDLIRTFDKHPGATKSAIEDAMSALGVSPPHDYVDFMMETNGAEGCLENGNYLMVYAIEQLVPCNEPYGLAASGLGLIIFGSDGGGTSYTFDIRQSAVRIVDVDSISMDLGPINVCGDTFLEFVQFLNAQPPVG